MRRSLALLLHRVVLRTARGPLRPLWSLLYRGLTRTLIHILGRGEDATAYIRAGFAYRDTLFGLSDVDFALVVGSPAARERVIRRWERLYRRLPSLRELYDVAVYDDALLADAAAATTLTYGLDRTTPRALYFGAAPLFDDSSLREHPGVYGPLRDWRRLHGAERRPPLAEQSAQERRIAAWLELQRWWRYAIEACADRSGPRKTHLCVKLVAEPARIWLWLAHGEQIARRDDVLKRALGAIPEEEQAFRSALWLDSALPHRPAPPLEEFIPYLLRLTQRIEALLAEEVWAEGTTQVGLVGLGSELAVQDKAEGLLPLADWRAVVWPSTPDETLAFRPGDPSDPRTLAEALAGEVGPQSALRSNGLLILPALRRVRLRAVQCRFTDPVSFALADGRELADFPNVAGWSAHDWARRAVAEHGAWLMDGRWDAPLTVREWHDREARRASPELRALGRMLTAARAALFLESCEQGSPALPLTASATAHLLGDTEDAYAEYRAARLGGPPPSQRTIAELRERVLRLPAYARDQASVPAAAAA